MVHPMTVEVTLMQAAQNRNCDWELTVPVDSPFPLRLKVFRPDGTTRGEAPVFDSGEQLSWDFFIQFWQGVRNGLGF